jgi:hypothetical protein
LRGLGAPRRVARLPTRAAGFVAGRPLPSGGLEVKAEDGGATGPGGDLFSGTDTAGCKWEARQEVRQLRHEDRQIVN